MTDSFPTERDLITALLDAVIALSDRIFPEERMCVRVQSMEPYSDRFVGVTGSVLTSWVNRAELEAAQAARS